MSDFDPNEQRARRKNKHINQVRRSKITMREKLGSAQSVSMRSRKNIPITLSIPEWDKPKVKPSNKEETK